MVFTVWASEVALQMLYIKRMDIPNYIMSTFVYQICMLSELAIFYWKAILRLQVVVGYIVGKLYESPGYGLRHTGMIRYSGWQARLILSVL